MSSFLTELGSSRLCDRLFNGATDTVFTKNGRLRPLKLFLDDRRILTSISESASVVSDGLVITYGFYVSGTTAKPNFAYIEDENSGNWLASVEISDEWIPTETQVDLSFKIEFSNTTSDFYNILADLDYNVLNKLEFVANDTPYLLDFELLSIRGGVATIKAVTELSDQDITEVNIGYLDSSMNYVECISSATVRSNAGADGELEILLNLDFIGGSQSDLLPEEEEVEEESGDVG